MSAARSNRRRVLDVDGMRRGGSRMHGVVLLAALLMLGCHDPLQPLSRPEPRAVAPPPIAGELRGTVDLAAGTLTFESIRVTGSTHLFSAQVYGNQGETVRLYNTPVSIVTTQSGRKTFTADVGLQNLLPHPIGDEQGGPAPSDTMGIFVFFTDMPTVTASTESCGTCTILLPGTQGTAAFTYLDQPYFFWPEIVGARDSGADTTLSRRRWEFDADPRVLNFSFRVLVYAAWPAPHSSRWRVEYRGDTVPDHSGTEPRWRTEGAGGTWSSSNGALTVDVKRGEDRYFYRRDSIAPEQDAYIEVRAQTIRSNNAQSRNTIGFADGVKHVAIAFSPAGVGFADSTGAFLSDAACACGGNVRAAPSSGWHAYTLQKFGADSAVILLNGLHVNVIAYSRLTTDPRLLAPMRSPLVFFGMTADTRGNGGGTAWETVRYELGAPSP